MEPLLLVCGGCRVKIRAADPDRARTRNCPRCASPLARAVEESLRADSSRAVAPAPGSLVPDVFAAETWRIGDPFVVATAPSKWRVRWIAIGATILGVSSVIHLLLSPTASSPGQSAEVPPSVGAAIQTIVWPSQAVEPPPRIDASETAASLVPVEPTRSAPMDLVEPITSPNSSATDALAELAFRVGEVVSSAPGSEAPAPPVPAADVKPARPSLAAPTQPSDVAQPPVELSPAGPAAPRRLLVRDEKGKAVVAREYGTTPRNEMAVVLPDGTIGWPTTQVFTDEPFVPNTIDQMERALRADEFATFRVVKTEHYLVLFQCSERFARDSADLLEELHEKLTGALRKQSLPVNPAEFPLVAIIFQSEDDFRANRKIAAEVQAYYDILSNRIFFFENGKRDTTAPEVSALRKPQTVVHEGTHQLLHNVGIQHRMSPWPIWLVEGLAEYCSPPKPLKGGGTDWAGLGQINVMHLTTIRDLDDPMSSMVRGGPKAPSGRDRGQPLVEYLVTRTDLTPTDYALSWGLTHYLARDRDRFPQFVAYIRKLNRLKPFEKRNPDEQLADFREAFGKDLAKLDAQVGKHLAKLKVPDSQALPYYAVRIEQPVSRTAVRRMAMVSQSPSVIRQWIDTASNSSGGQINYDVSAWPTRTRAELTADDWVQQGR